MTRIESKKVAVNCPQAECFEFLTDMNNYELLLPKKNISDWNSDEKTCSFKIQKTYKLVYTIQKSKNYVASKSKIIGGICARVCVCVCVK